MPRARQNPQAGQGSARKPRSSNPAAKAVDESVDAPAESEREQLVDESVAPKSEGNQDNPAAAAAAAAAATKAAMPDVKVKKVTINAPDEPKTASCCYCCCFETGLYWE